MQGGAYVDGRFVAPEDAKISIFDWGFLHGDATYDVAHVWQGRFFRLDDHLDRFMAFAIPFVWIADPAKQRRGVDLVVGTPQRIPAASVDPRVKNYHWLDFVTGLFEAYGRGGETVVLTDGAGRLTEGPGFNVFVVKGGALATPASGVLEGVSRRTVIELARDAGLPVAQRAVTVDELRAADEVFLSSTGGGVIPVAAVDGVPVAGRPAGVFGPVSERLQAAYWALHEDPRYGEPVHAAGG